MQLGVIFAIVVMLLSVLLPSGITNASLASLWNDPNGPWASVQNKFNQIFSIAGGGKSNQVLFGNTLTIQGTVDLPTTTVMTYVSTDLSNAYMTGVTFDTFDGHIGWATHTKPPTQTHNVGLADEIVPESTFETQVSQTVQLVNAPSGPYVFALGEPADFSFPITAHSDGILLNSKDTTGSYTDWQAAPGAVRNGTRYTATSFVSTATADQLRKVPSPEQRPDLYSRPFQDRYLQLPSDLQNPNDESVLKGQQVITQASATNMFDEAMALVNFFHSSFQYTTNPHDVPQGQDVVDTLLDRGIGYCTWFATGFTMMARELGLPARVVEGFAPGAIDPRQPGVRVIKGTDAHAWSQVYFAGYGWINFEPSASFIGSSLPTKAPTGPTTDPNQTPPRSPVTHRPNPPTSGSSTPVTKSKTSATTTVNPVVQDVGVSLSLIIALALLAVLAGLTWWRILFRGLTPIGQAFARMAFLGRFAGAKPLRSQTATEYGSSLAERLPGQRTAIEEITNLYVLERWAPAAPEATPTLGERWHTLRGALVRSIMRRRPRRARSPDDVE